MSDHLFFNKGKKAKNIFFIVGGVLFGLLLLLVVAVFLTDDTNTAEPPLPVGEEIETPAPVETATGDQTEEENNIPDEANKPDENETNSGSTETAVEEKTFTVEPNPQNFNQDGISFVYPGAVFGPPALEQGKGFAEIEMGGPYPDYEAITFDSFSPPFSTLFDPYMLIYPAYEYRRMNNEAAEVIELLHTLLNDLQKIKNVEELPYLPTPNAVQAFHSNVEIIEFNNGKGLRYLTAYYQDYSPVTNEFLEYTFQGITTDGRYYVSVSIPLYHFGLPDNHEVFFNSHKEEVEELENDYQGFMAKIARKLDESAQNEFNPPLKELDEMIKTLQIR